MCLRVSIMLPLKSRIHSQISPKTEPSMVISVFGMDMRHARNGHRAKGWPMQRCLQLQQITHAISGQSTCPPCSFPPSFLQYIPELISSILFPYFPNFSWPLLVCFPLHSSRYTYSSYSSGGGFNCNLMRASAAFTFLAAFAYSADFWYVEASSDSQWRHSMLIPWMFFCCILVEHLLHMRTPLFSHPFNWMLLQACPPSSAACCHCGCSNLARLTISTSLMGSSCSAAQQAVIEP